MTKTGHNLTGAIVGSAVFLFLQNTVGISLINSTICGYLIYKGSNAPDYLEFAKFDKEKLRRTSLIPHRTYTHWTLMWILLFGLGILGMYQISFYWIFLSAFSFGCLLHLLMDYPNPSGIPFIYPTRRKKSLKWWKSGEHERKIVLVMLIGFFVLLHFYHYEPFIGLGVEIKNWALNHLKSFKLN